MPLQSKHFPNDEAMLVLVKEMSGKRIETRRKQERITQEKFASDVGIGVRWLREIEAGNPKSRIDDHFRCAHRLGLSTGHILIPLLFMEYDMIFPRHLLLDDLSDLERRCIDVIAEHKLDSLARQMRPHGPLAARGGAR